MKFELPEERLARYQQELITEMFHHICKVKSIEKDIENALLTDDEFWGKFKMLRGHRYSKTT
jgi:hypothetical protein